MSTAATVPGAIPAKSGKKKLIVILAAALLLVAATAGGLVVWLKARAHAGLEAEEAEGAGEVSMTKATSRRDPNAVPVFVPLESFTVNLADREADRYAQVSVTLELNDAKDRERIKVFMPAIRNNILMVLAHKRSADLLERAGKEKLAEEVQRETERALGIEPPTTGTPERKRSSGMHPVRAVHFSNFIIQ